MHVYNLATFVWDKVKWPNQQYRRYDAKTTQGETTSFFKETGNFHTVTTDPLWDDSSYRRCFTRLAADGYNSIEFTVPSQAWQFNFIYRTDAEGCEKCSIKIEEGDGFMEVWNGSEWVEANGYFFSMRQKAGTRLQNITFTDPATNELVTLKDVQVGGNSIYQKRLKMRCLSHDMYRRDGTPLVNGAKKRISISGTGRFMYWGVEWSTNQYMITYINAARGSHNPRISSSQLALIHYQDTDIWEHHPDLILSEDPIFNGDAGSPSRWVDNEGKALLPSTYFAAVTENFFFADNSVSLKSRGQALFGKDYNLEFAIFSPYVTALDGKMSESGELLEFTLSDGVTWSVYNAQLSIYEFFKEKHPNIIYLNCSKIWMDICEKVYGGISNGTIRSGKEGETLTSDGVHPNTRGSRVWARLILPIFDFVN